MPLLIYPLPDFVLQVTDYLPFGQSNTYEVNTTRVKGKKGGYTNKYQFANKQEDTESDLQYFEKRYYDNRIGRFTTEDPVYWEVGHTKRPDNYFTDSQQWNSYSYVRNNPINLVDPTGEETGALPSSPLEVVVWVLGTAIRGYWEMGKFIAVEGAIAIGTIGTVAIQNQGLVDVVTNQGSTSPAPNTPNLGNIPGGKPPEKPDKPKVDKPTKPEVKYKEPKPGVSGKEGAKDIPSWAKGQRPTTTENGKQFADRIMKEKYGNGNYDKGPRSEYQQIQKYGDRNFQNPPSTTTSSSSH